MSDVAPPELVAVQTAFLRTLTGDEDLLRAALREGGLSADRRVGIYRNAYASRLVEALQALLPLTAMWLGRETFEAGASAYVAEHVPAHWRLDTYGRDFGEWLICQDPDWRAAADLARLEIALRRAFDGPGSACVDPEVLTALRPREWLGLCVDFVPVCERLAVSAGTLAAWHSLRIGERPATPRADAPAVVVQVWRQAGQSSFRSLDPPLARLADRLQAGEPFAAACLGAGLDPTRGAAALHDWIRESLVCSIRIDPDNAAPD